LQWINVLEQQKANQHARQKEKLREEVLCARAGTSAETLPLSPVYVPNDPPKEEGGADHAEDDAAREEKDPREHAAAPSFFIVAFVRTILRYACDRLSLFGPKA